MQKNGLQMGKPICKPFFRNEVEISGFRLRSCRKPLDVHFHFYGSDQ